MEFDLRAPLDFFCACSARTVCSAPAPRLGREIASPCAHPGASLSLPLVRPRHPSPGPLKCCSSNGGPTSSSLEKHVAALAVAPYQPCRARPVHRSQASLSGNHMPTVVAAAEHHTGVQMPMHSCRRRMGLEGRRTAVDDAAAARDSGAGDRGCSTAAAEGAPPDPVAGALPLAAAARSRRAAAPDTPGAAAPDNPGRIPRAAPDTPGVAAPDSPGRIPRAAPDSPGEPAAAALDSPEEDIPDIPRAARHSMMAAAGPEEEGGRCRPARSRLDLSRASCGWLSPADRRRWSRPRRPAPGWCDTRRLSVGRARRRARVTRRRRR